MWCSSRAQPACPILFTTSPFPCSPSSLWFSLTYPSHSCRFNLPRHAPLGSCCQSKCRSEDPKKISASDFRLKVFIGELRDLKESAMILQNALSGILMRENKERSYCSWTCSLNLSIVWRLFMSSFMNFLYLLYCSSSHLSIDYRFINLLYILFCSSLHLSIV